MLRAVVQPVALSASPEAEGKKHEGWPSPQVKTKDEADGPLGGRRDGAGPRADGAGGRASRRLAARVGGPFGGSAGARRLPSGPSSGSPPVAEWPSGPGRDGNLGFRLSPRTCSRARYGGVKVRLRNFGERLCINAPNEGWCSPL